MTIGRFLRDKQLLHAITVLIGTMVGVGVFGVPFVFAKAGFWVGLVFLLFAAGATMLLNLLYAEVILRTPTTHQLVGYTSIYLGRFFRMVILFVGVLTIYGALLAYIIISGEFLHNVLSQFFAIPPQYYSIGFFAVVSALLLFRLRTVAFIEFAMTLFFIAVVLVIFGIGIPQMRLENLTAFTPEFWFLPYGVLLFAMAGLTSIPIQRQILNGRERELKPAIIIAVSVAALLYLVFAFTVVGVSGEITSPDALEGLLAFLGYKIIFLGSLFGVLAIFTSYLMLGTALVDVFSLDYGIKRRTSWFLAVLPAILLFFSGMRNFIDVISLIGSVAIGIEAVVVIILVLRARKKGNRPPEFTIRVPRPVLYLLALVFAAGAIYAFLGY